MYKNAVWLAAATVLDRGLTLVAFAAAAASLGPTAFGVAAFAQAVSYYAYAAADLGLPTTLIRTAALRQGTSAEVVLPAILVRAAASTIVGLGLWTVVRVAVDPAAAQVIMLFYLAAAAAAFNLAWLFQGLERANWLVLSEGLRGTITVAGVTALVRGPSDMIRLPVILGFSTLVSAAVQLAMARVQLGTLATRRKVVGEMYAQLIHSAPVGLGGLLVQSYFQLNILILKRLGGTFETGVYAGCARLAAIPLSAAALFGIALLPRLTAAAADPRQLRAQQQSLFLQCAAIVVPFAGAALWFSPQIVARTLGASYATGVPAIRWLILFVSISALNLPFAQTLIATDRLRQYFVGVGLGAAASVASSIPLIRGHGASGAAAASTLGAMVASSWLVWRALSSGGSR